MADAQIGHRHDMVGQMQQTAKVVRPEDADPAHPDAFGPRGQPQVLHCAGGGVQIGRRVMGAAQHMRAAARAVAGDASPVSFIFFVQITSMLDRCAVAFAPTPFYRSVTRYFDGESRIQAGFEEVKASWDRYRGGLEHLLARFAARLPADALARCELAIGRFTRIRMHVGLRLRTAEGKDWVGNYHLASRLRAGGDDSLLPAPYEFYRINAAFEYLMGLQPFAPERAKVAYYREDPPRLLSSAQGFDVANLTVLDDRSSVLPEYLILITSQGPADPGANALVVSEEELLARFP